MRGHWQQMLALLTNEKTKPYILALRAEFEAEGSRGEEVRQLAHLAASAGLSLDLKIGGAEAVRDLHEAFILGASRIIAPMIETPYALQKFVTAAKRVYQDHLSHVKLLINIETITACQTFPDMLALPDMRHIFGVVIGRVDLAASMGLKRQDINAPVIFDLVQKTAAQAKEKGLAVVLGGAITVDALPFLSQFSPGCIDYLDTRKMALHYPLTAEQFTEAIDIATRFELLWLENKRDFHRAISTEDQTRIEMLKERSLAV
ncbi:MAG: aldolase/citrate lyase family protein [Gammaproteobacteria bacterium]|nr:aldolase/citrate lyase family protein [Gammaproteobacteria bacterium]